ncbi:MAG TPA: hypothetical protein VG426_10070 [Candidatus Dormibacteraeota bacterium]|nr:hypothetical protein [Candidatus Dormibacteraeota bacterium]
MEDLVALRVRLKDGGVRYFLTWGRLFDPVDPKPLEAVVKANLGKFALQGEANSVEVCESLQEASRQPYFFEALWWFAQQTIPYGSGYMRWAIARRRRLEVGKELRFLGVPTKRTARPPDQ